MEKYISIINNPTSATDCVVSGNTVSITGLKPFLKSNIKSCKIKKSLWPTPVKVAAAAIPTAVGGTVSFSIDQTVNGILQTFYFSYVVDSAANLNAAIAAWSASSNANVTVVGTGASLGSQIITATADTANVSFEIGGKFVTSAGVVTPMDFEPVVTSFTNITTVRNGFGYLQLNFDRDHNLKTGQVIKCYGFTNQGTVLNNNFFRVGFVDTDTVILYNMNGTFVFVASTTLAGTGSAELVASSEFGTYTQVNAEAAANGSTQTATDSTYSYSCLEITGTYENSAMGNLSQPQLFTANVWYADAAADGETSVIVDGSTAYDLDRSIFDAGIID